MALTLPHSARSPDRLDLLDATYLKWIFLTLAVLSGGGFWGMYYICTGDATKVLEGGDGPGFCWRVTSESRLRSVELFRPELGPRLLAPPLHRANAPFFSKGASAVLEWVACFM